MAPKTEERPHFIGFYAPKNLQKWAVNKAKTDKRSLSKYLVNLIEMDMKHGKNPKIGS